jgi:molybdopterin-guanine dinucleotide biosynthesis protein A
MTFDAVILAGGTSSRMGRDKAFLEFGGQTLLARQIALTREVGAREVFISGREGVDYSAFGCRVLVDNFPNSGPAAGIERALEICASPLILVLAVDMPAMNAAMLRRLLASCDGVGGVIPKTRTGIEPLAAIYPKAARDNPAVRCGTELQQGRAPGARWLAQECVAAGLARFVEVSDADAEFFVSANTPDTFRLMARATKAS